MTAKKSPPDKKAGKRAENGANAPIPGVGVIIWRDDRFLLIRRAKPPRQGEWSIPGGKQKLGETVHETARREVLEETGLKIRIIGLVDVIDLLDWGPGGETGGKDAGENKKSGGKDAGENKKSGGKDAPPRFHYTLIDLAAVAEAGEPVAGSDAEEAAWFSLEDIKSLDLWEETERVIRLSHEMVEISEAI